MAGRKETVSDKEILRFFEQSPDHFLTTNEVAEYLDFSKQGTRKRLYALADEELLDFKKVGRNPAWWLTDEGRDFLSDENE